MGQGVKEQFGPVLPTLKPSGQSFASIVQAVWLGSFFTNKYAADALPTIKRSAIITAGKIGILNLGFGGIGRVGGTTGACSAEELIFEL